MTTNTKNLSAALAECGRVMKTRTTLPILSCVRLEAVNGTLKLLATDLDAWIERTIECDGELEACCVGFHKFQSLINASSSEQVSLEKSGSRLLLNMGASKCQLPTTDAKEFPTCDTSDAKPIAAPLEDLAEGLEAVSYSCMKEGIAFPVLANVLVTLEAKALKCFACDGRGGSYFHRPLICSAQQFMVQEKFCAPVSGLLREEESQLLLSERFLVAKSKSGSLSAKRPEGKYSESWELNANITGGEPTTLARSVLAKALSCCEAIGSERMKVVHDGENITFSTDATDESYSELFPAGGPASNAIFNPCYLRGVMLSFGDMVKYSVSDHGAVLFESGDLKFILMQLRA